MRRSPPPAVLAVIFATTGLALIALALTVVLAPLQVAVRPSIEALGLGLGVLLARRFPVHLTDKTKTAVATVPFFAAAVLLSAPLALAVAALGIAGAELWRHTRWFQGLFNTSAGLLQVAAAAAVFGLLAGHTSLASLQPADWLPAALCAAIALYLTGLLLVEFIVSVQLRRLVLRRFWQRVWPTLPQEALLSLLGLLLALLLVQAPWAVVFLPAPAWLVYRSLIVMARGLSPATASSAPVHLAQLPRRLQLFIVATGATATLCGLIAGVVAPGVWSAHTALVAALLVGLAVATYRLPIKPAPKHILVLDVSMIMAAVVALAPGAMVIVVAVSSALGNTVQRRPWFNTCFNVAQRALAALAAAVVYRLLAPTPLTSAFSWAGGLAAMAGAAAYWLTSVSLVDGISALQLHRSPFAHWVATHRQSLVAHVVLLPLGIAVAPALGAAPWLLLLLPLPAFVVRVLLHTALQLDTQTELLVDDLLAAVAERQPALATRAERLGGLARALANAYGLPASACNALALAARLVVVAELLEPTAQTAAGSLVLDADDIARRQLLQALLALPTVAEALTYRQTAYDGSSDPAGPRGAGIPLAARILSLCEGWLGIVGEQPAPAPTEELARLLPGVGTAWDPELAGLLVRVVQQPGGPPLSVAA